MITAASALGSFLVLAQGDAAPGGAAGPLSLLTSGLFPFIIIGVLFYLLLIRPERRKRAEMSQMLEALQKNDRIVTIGGIYGVVLNAPKGSEDVTIRVDENSNTKLRILRSAISRVVRAEDGDNKKDSA
jgi:preprotein translocase subunit YajC